MFNPRKEVALDNLNLSDLVLQFKLMKAMGYKSLFDPEFRRELKNPYRKHLYYKILITEELVNRNILFKYIGDISDKLSFFSDPELYHKIKDREKKAIMEENPNSTASKELQNKHKSIINKHMTTEEEQEKIKELLANLTPRNSMQR